MSQTALAHHPLARRSWRSRWAMAIVVLAAACLVGGASRTQASDLPAKWDARLQRLVMSEPAHTRIVAWVVFTDKGAAGKSRVSERVVSERSLQRRAKVRPATALVDARDLPVVDAYVDAVAAHGLRIRRTSRWLNAVSVEGSATQLQRVADLDQVEAVRLLSRFRRTQPQDERAPTPPDDGHGSSGASDAPSQAPDKGPRDTINMLDYGASFGQLDQIGVPTLHDQGYVGQGVLIGHFDNGYRLMSHEVFDSLHVAGTRDFVDGDIDPAPDPGDPSSYGAHGIVTLSTLAGFKEGELIGPAYEASLLLARTENDASETPLEEDNWVAAMEWADSLGADVITASLAYLEYDDPFPDWTWQDMDGNTTVITQAADHAVSLGIIVLNSAGNRGLPGVGEGNSLMAPADGDEVLTIGSVTNAGSRSSFSSVGPTFDGRLKPDLMAQGSSTRRASASNPTGYGNSSGTSLSCPLVAGVVAQLLSAQPTATPLLIRDALRLTASQSQAPDSLMGWGIVNAVAALAFLEASDSEAAVPSLTRLTANVPNPFNPTTTIAYELAAPAHVSLQVFDVRGQRVRTLIDGHQAAQRHHVVWDGRSDDGSTASSGVYFARLQTSLQGRPGTTSIRKMTLVR